MKIRTLKQLGLDERISSSTGIEHLEQLRRNWSKVPMFLNTGDLDIARKLVGTTLWHTYLFGGVTVPRYAEHVFGSITTPQDDVDGGILANTMRFIAEEICTNNVFEGDGESHSHYFDLRRAYGQAQASLDKVCIQSELLQNLSLRLNLRDSNKLQLNLLFGVKKWLPMQEL